METTQEQTANDMLLSSHSSRDPAFANLIIDQAKVNGYSFQFQQFTIIRSNGEFDVTLSFVIGMDFVKFYCQ